MILTIHRYPKRVVKLLILPSRASSCNLHMLATRAFQMVGENSQGCIVHCLTLRQVDGVSSTRTLEGKYMRQDALIPRPGPEYNITDRLHEHEHDVQNRIPDFSTNPEALPDHSPPFCPKLQTPIKCMYFAKVIQSSSFESSSVSVSS